MNEMRKGRIISLVARSVLFALILGLGTLAALVADETAGLASTDLSGVAVQAMATSADGALYASLAGGPQPAGIYRSDDEGRTWQRVSSGPGLAVHYLAVQSAASWGSVLYAATAGDAQAGSLWLSYDGGRTWYASQVDLPTDSYITVRANGGEPKYVPAQTSMTPRSLLQALSLTTNGAVEFWLNGAKIDWDGIVPIGAVMTIVGSVKGGAF